MKKLFTLRYLLLVLVLMGGVNGSGQVARWNFFGQSSPATSVATATNANVTVSSLTRGTGAVASSASNSFRTAGFSNNGISTSNTDYFQFTLKANTGYTLSLTSIASIFNGTATFYASPGVTSQYAYSLDGTTFTLIGSASTSTSLSLSTTLSGISVLQTLPATTTVTIRYFASGQTTTGGWGYSSPSVASTDDGLSVSGTVSAIPSTVIISDNGSQPAASNITSNSIKNILQTFTIANDATASATLNTVTVPLTGTYLPADINGAGIKLYTNSTNNLSTATVLKTATPVASGSGETITFGSLSQSLAVNTTTYYWVTVDISATPTDGRTIAASALSTSNFTFASANKSGSVSQGGTQTITNITPGIALSSQNQIAAAPVSQGATGVLLSNFQAAVTNANATLNSIAVITGGTYSTASFITNYKLFYNATANTFAGAAQIGSTQSSIVSGGTITFVSLNTTITNGSTGYFWVIADVAINATVGQTVNIASNPVFSFASGTPTGSIAAGGDQTIVSCTPTDVTSPAASSASLSSVLSWINPNCFDEILIVAATASNTGTPTGDGTAYTGNLSYGSGSSLGNGFVVYRGVSSPQTVTNLINGSTYFYKFFTRRGTTWTTGIEVSATPYLQGYYWNGGDPTANPANGGTGTWGTPNAWRQPTPTGSQATFANGNAAFFAGVAGTVTLPSSATFTTKNIQTNGYTFTGVSSLTGDIIQSSGVTSTYSLPSTSSNTTFSLNGNFSGGTTVNLEAGATGSNISRFNLGNSSSTSYTWSTPIVVTGTGFAALSAGGTGSSATSTYSGNITGNGSRLNLGGGTGYTVNFSGVISGNNDVRISSAGNGGGGTVVFSGANTFTGNLSLNNSSTTGVVKISGGDNRFPTTALFTMGETSGNGAGTFDLNGNSQQFAGLTNGGQAGGTITNTAASTVSTLTISGSTSPAVFSGLIINGTGTVAVAKSGSGTLIFSGANTYTGGTTISLGILQLGAAGVLADAGVVILNAGTLKTGATTGFSETVGTLALTDNSTISLGTGVHTLTFAASNGVTWTSGKTLTITGWTGTAGATGSAGKIFVGTTSSGLTSAQLGQINFSGYTNGARILSTGEIVPVVPTYVITSSAAANGSISPSGSTTVNSGDNVTYTITPDACYAIADVLVDGVSVGAVGTYTFTNVTANHTISATFVQTTYTITVTAGVNGSITPGTGSVNCGTDATYTITPAACYAIADVLVDGVSQGAVSSFTFTNVTANHTISASFVQTTYTITVTAGANGTVTPGTGNVNCGDNATYTIAANAGYTIANVIVDGNSQGVISSYTFSNVTASHSISATFNSSNADLSNLTITAGALAPPFSSSQNTYTVNVDNSTSATTVTPTVADANATVTVNSVPVTSGSASGPITLLEGANNITVIVTAQDGTTTKTYTITVNRASPSALPADLTINDVTQTEGNSGTSTFTFTVSLSSAAPAGGVTFTYNTTDGTATTAGSDYVATSGTGTILQGSTSTTITVTVNGDATVEGDETFNVNLSNPTNANITDNLGVGTITNDDAAPVTPGAALNFGGANDFISINSAVGNFGTADFAIEIYIKATQTESYLLSKRGVCNIDNFFNLKISGGKALFEIANTTGEYISVQGTSIVNDNTWHHLAVTRKSGTVSLYVDGVPQGTAATTVNINSSYPVTLGYSVCDNVSGDPYSGDMDEVRIWNRALSACEIAAYRNCEIATTAPNLAVNYHFNQGVAGGNNSGETTLNDASGNNNNGTLMNFALTGTTSNWIAPGAVTSGTSCAIKNWVGNTGNWNDPNGWSPLGVPVATDNVIIDASDNVTVPGAYNAVAKSINISGGGTVTTNSTALLEVNGGCDALSITGSGSQFSNAGTLRLGNNTVIAGNGINLSGGSFLNANGGLIEINRTDSNAVNVVGDAGTTFTNNGTLKIGNLGPVATNPSISKNGIYQTAGTFTNSATTGFIEINSTVLDGLSLANSGTSFSNSGSMQIGNLTTSPQDGIFITGGTLNNNTNGTIKIFQANRGLVLFNTTAANFANQTGATLEINDITTNAIYVDGSLSNNGTMRVGNTGPITSGAALLFEGGNIVNSSTAIMEGDRLLDANNGRFITTTTSAKVRSFTNSGSINVGSKAPIASVAILIGVNTTFTNHGSIIANNVGVDVINTSGVASFINNGSIKSGNSGTLGRSGLNLRPGSSITNNASGTIEIDNITNAAVGSGGVVFRDGGGTVTNAGIIKMGTVTAISAGIVNNNNGGGVFNNTGTLTYGNVVNNGVGATQTVTNNNGGIIQTTANGFLKIAGTLTNNSGATVTNSSTGIVTVNGTLNNNSGATVTNDGNLKGSGTIVQSSTFSNTSGSFISPGQSPGQLNVTGNFDLGSATYNCEINGTTAATQYDVIAVSGTATLTNSSLVVNWGSFTPAVGDSYSILTAGTITGNFSSVTIPPISGRKYTVTYTATAVIINVLVGSATSDFYRTITTGNWSDANTWESATDAAFTTGVVSPATSAPDFNANRISIRNTHTVTVTTPLTIDETTVNAGGALVVDPNVVLTLNDGINTDLEVLTGGSMTIKSISTGTGSIGNSTSADISGNVTVERFISSLNNRAYRLLGSSVNTFGSTKPLIRDNWQEGTNNTTIGTNNDPAPGFGTHITGSTTGANGFDATFTGQGSMFTYNQSSDTYAPAGSTTVNFDAKTGYLLYIRGDRTASNIMAAATSSNTTLRTTGSILFGTQTFPGLTGNFSLVTNPYPSAINWATIYGNNPGFTDYYTYVDPNIGDRGGYVTVTSGNVRSVNDPANNPGSPLGTTDIQSGQAFFVKTLSGTQILTIREVDKSTTNNLNVFRTTAAAQQFTASLFFNSATLGRRIADGVTALYDNSYNAALDGHDAIEIANYDENIAIARAGTNLSIEERPIITSPQTMPLFISNMKQQGYEWEFNQTNFAPNMVAQLVDKFTGVNTYLNINSATVVSFTVTADAASKASDRFFIQFSPSVALPVTISSVKAYQKNTGVQVEWIIQTENNMDRYEVERSANGQSFTSIGSVASKGNSNVVVNYNLFDAVPLQGVSFYRIKSVDKNGKITYSVAVKVNISSVAKNTITISPNPVTGSSVAIQINLPKGNYTFVLTNKLGQLLANKVVQHAGGITTETLEPSADFAAGVYQLKVKGNGINITEQVIKK